ncbi:hypothetical protein [Roseibium alexandrii]|uniref:hypothetical protein n=1 Tax=Roseibium alexandrii TaxID=388408 RepID=UPI00058C86FA|nr:hypothetical protein [Roseibium alexandrii]
MSYQQQGAGARANETKDHDTTAAGAWETAQTDQKCRRGGGWTIQSAGLRRTPSAAGPHWVAATMRKFGHDYLPSFIRLETELAQHEAKEATRARVQKVLEDG